MRHKEGSLGEGTPAMFRILMDQVSIVMMIIITIIISSIITIISNIIVIIAATLIMTIIIISILLQLDVIKLFSVHKLR